MRNKDHTYQVYVNWGKAGCEPIDDEVRTLKEARRIIKSRQWRFESLTIVKTTVEVVK
jgi:hypothetical protein